MTVCAWVLVNLAMSSDPYSRMVSFLKVALPLVALGLLSTLFLLSSRIEPGETIPFAEGEIADRIAGQQVTGPFFSSVTGAGDEITFSAKDLVTGLNSTNEARDVFARLDFFGGGSVTMVANRGEIRADSEQIDLEGDILIDSTTGYRMRTDTLSAELNQLDINAPGEVQATGPAGNLTAGNMRIFTVDSDQGAQLLFSGGVKLIYDPKTSK